MLRCAFCCGGGGGGLTPDAPDEGGLGDDELC